MRIRTIETSECNEERNAAVAGTVRDRLTAHRIPALTLVSQRGAGKTLILERTLRELQGRLKISVVTGDLEAERDANRLARCSDEIVHAVITEAPQRLDASHLSAALDAIDLARTDLVLIENAGGITRPRLRDLGDEATVSVISATASDRELAQQASLLRTSDYTIINKVDLRTRQADRERLTAAVQELSPNARVFRLSALTGEGFGAWLTFLEAHVGDAVLA